MKVLNFVIFLSIVLLIYSSVNYYVLRRALQAIPDNSHFKFVFAILFIILASLFFAGRFLEKPLNSDITYYFIWIGSFWLAAILYFFLIVLLLDILRLTNSWFSYFPEFITKNWIQTKLIALTSSVILVIIILTAGFLNNFYPYLKKLNVNIPKKESSIENLRIVMASDIHLGVSITNQQIKNLVNIINEQKPDIILLAGDILDDDPKYLIKNNLGAPLKELRAKYGVWGITGNHEYIGGIERAVNYINSLGIKMLRDISVIIDSSFNLVGREDLSIKSWGHRVRKELSTLLSDVNPNLPTILMDHQPFKLKEASELPIDLQISGHTHHGQLYPFNFITKAIYEKSFGYLKINKTHFYVSCGYGVWGPPIRTVSRSEIVRIDINFTK